MKKTLLTEIICFLLILLYAYTGLSKLVNHETFQLQLVKHPLLRNWSEAIAWILPAGELVLAVLLSVPVWRRVALYISMVLLIVFTAYIIYMLSFYPHLPCSCGGVVGELSWQQHVFFNLFFLVINITAVRWDKKVVATSSPAVQRADSSFI